MEPEVLPNIVPTNSDQDKKIAYISLRLLFWVSLLHGIWLTFRNLEHIRDSIYYLTPEYLEKYGFKAESVFFLVVFVIIIALNFIPPIWAKRLYKKGLYKKQIKTGIVSFIVFQILLHLLLSTLKIVGATNC